MINRVSQYAVSNKFIKHTCFRPLWKLGLYSFIYIGIIINSFAQEQKSEKVSQFKDTTDNAFDISLWMAQVYGFVPIVSLITEPAIGYGAAGGLIFVHRDKEEMEKGDMSPPSLSAVGGLYTENGTWGTFLYHQGIWKKDRIRYLGILGYASANLTYYREVPIFGERGFSFNLEGTFLVQEISIRLGSSPFFLGGRYSYFTSKSTFKLGNEELPVDPRELKLNIGELGPVVIFDQRDNTFTPNKGSYGKIIYSYYNEIFGSDQEFSKLDSYWYGFAPAGKKWTLGLRADARVSWGNVPFYAKPFVTLRGVPLMRYQADRVLVLETEERWDVTNRWSLVGFAGAGKAFPDQDSFSERPWAYSVGGGFRYLLARLLNIYAGIDVARGPEDWAFYITFGHYWNSL